MTAVSREQVRFAIYGQESSHGKADTSQENYAGARGPMQVTAPTFDALKNKGLIPSNYKHDNPEHTKQAGNALVDYLYDKYSGDPSMVAAAYYAGEKAVRADGTIADFRDKRNAKAPTTLQYVSQIMKRLGDGDTALVPAPVPAAKPTNAMAYWDRPMPEPLGPKAGRSVDDKGVVYNSDYRPAADATFVSEDSKLAAGEAAAQAAAAEVKDSGFIDKSRAAFMHNGVVGPLIKELVKPDFLPTPGFKLDTNKLNGLSQDDQEYLKESGSAAEAEWIMYDIQQRAEDLRTVNLSGAGVGVAATIFGGLPEGMLTGLGVAKGLQAARVGSLALAAEGRMGAAAVSSVAENVGGNLAFTAIQDKFDPYVGATDYAMAAGMGLLGVVLNAPGTFSAYRTATAKAAQALADTAGVDMMALRRQATVNLGPEADSLALTAEVKRLEANGIRETTAVGLSQLPEGRRLLAEDAALRIDEPAAADMGVTDIGTSGMTRPNDASAKPDYFDKTGDSAARTWMARNNDVWKRQISEIEGTSMAAADNLPSGVHVLPGAKSDVALGPAVKAVQDLAAQFLPGSKIIVGIGKVTDGAGAVKDPSYNGVVISAGDTHFVGLKAGRTPTEAVNTAMHELGHAVFHTTSRDIPADLLARMVKEHDSFIKDLRAGKGEARFKRFAEGSDSTVDAAGKLRGAIDQDKNARYVESFDEYTAEAFVRHIQKSARDAGSEIKLDKGVVSLLKAAWDRVKELWESARAKGFLPKDEAFDEFFTRVLKGQLAEQQKLPAIKESEYLDAGLIANFDRAAEANTLVNDPVAIKHGLNLLPVGTPQQQAEAKALTALYAKAEAGGYKVDEKRLSALLNTSVFKGAQSTANTMLRSDNPVMRMVAAELLESASGAAGRRTSASIAKQLNYQAYLGNTLNDVQGLYTQWRNSQGVDIRDDFFGGKMWSQFNRMVAEEIEARRVGANEVQSPPAVKDAADKLQDAYERMRGAQTSTKTIGWASLPTSSKGYMPHRMSPEKLRNATNAQMTALHGALRDQFISIEGFDITFADNLASKYLDRVRQRALGGFEAPAGVHQVGAADVVEEALESMGLNREQITAMMGKYMAGGAGHTKKRLSLDLNSTHTAEDGTTFRLLDLFETDQFALLRTQANRVSGEVALARHGIMGKSGLKLLRRAMEFGADGQRVQANELEAYDQVAAEFLGDKFGTQNKFVDRVMQVNSLARLGGMGFTQFAEGINGVFHVGAARALDAVTSMPRLRKEIKALAKGEKVDNPIIGSLERFSGAEFGTESYKTVFPFDNQSLEYQTYGRETLSAGDRLLRGGGYLQGKLSLWRSIHSTQQRGMAEQIVRKAAQYLQDGTSDAALRDMGISDDLLVRLRKDLPSIAEFDGGKLTNFDITKASDLQAAEEFTQAIHRGVSQIIQGTFIGETGKWSHDGLMRLMTQFRTFSLVSVEKQWARQRGNVGTAKTLGMMVGAMSLAAPIYMARTYLASIGRPDQEAYLEKNLQPDFVARATLNYIAMSGLAGDFLDAMTTVTGLRSTGGRAGAASEFVGNVVAPAAGLVDDVWRGLQNTKEGTDPHDLMKTLPFNRLPWMIPALNAFDD